MWIQVWSDSSTPPPSLELCCTDLSPSSHVSALSLNFSFLSSKWKASGFSPSRANTLHFSGVGWDFCTGLPTTLWSCLSTPTHLRYLCGIWWGPLYSSMCVLLNLDFRSLAFWLESVEKLSCWQVGMHWKSMERPQLPRRCIISGRMHTCTPDAVLHLFLLKHSATYTLT